MLTMHCATLLALLGLLLPCTILAQIYEPRSTGPDVHFSQSSVLALENDVNALSRHDFAHPGSGAISENQLRVSRILRSMFSNAHDTTGARDRFSYSYSFDPDRTVVDWEFWREDTQDWFTYNRMIYEYDEYGHQTLYEWLYWSSEHDAWGGNSRIVTRYNERGQELDYALFYWNAEAWDWQEQTRIEYEYDEDGNLLEQLQVSRRHDGGLERQRKRFLYDEHGRAVSAEASFWEEKSESWDAIERTTWSYEGLVEQHIIEISGVDEWVKSRQVRELFNDRGLLIEETRSDWDYFEEGWVPVFKRAFEYDDQGRTTLERQMNTNSITGSLGYVMQEESMWNEAGQIVERRRSGWSDLLDDWEPASRTVYVYDENGYRTDYMVNRWDATSSSWWLSTHEEIFWAAITTEISAESTLPAQISLHPNYPNPFNPTTSIPFTLANTAHVRLSILDMSGREVLRLTDRPFTAGTHTIPFNASGLATGVYVYRLQSGEQFHARKLVLVR